MAKSTGSLQGICVGETGKRIDAYMINPRKLVIDPGFNVRDKSDPEVAANIRSLADEMKQNGIQYIPALTVYMRGDEVVVTDGYCRTEGALLAISEGAQVPYLPIRPEEKHSNEVDRTFSLLKRNEHGLALTPLQQAAVVKRLLGLGLSDQEVADRACKSIAHIKQLVILLSSPQDVKEMVKSGEVSASQAIKTVRKHGEKAKEILGEAVETAKAKGKSKATAKHIKSPGTDRSSRTAPGNPAGQELVVTTYATDWNFWGPKLKTALEEIRDADSQAERLEKIAAATELLKGMS
jgi:ParB family chromosome partitioning protein